MKILITGAKGQLGQALQKQLQQANDAVPCTYTVIPTDYDTMDITSKDSVEAMFTKVQPDVVINCAAHTAVDKCEEEVERADAINHQGPRHLAEACEACGAKLVQVSTDYVFSGTFNGKALETVALEKMAATHVTAATLATRQAMADTSTPWIETSPIAPQSVYGTTKAQGEEAVRTLCTKHFIIRTAWLYGEGPNFVRTMLQLAKTHPRLTVVADQYGNPTSTKDLAKVIIALVQTEHYGTYHGTCEGTCSWYDFAQTIFALSGVSIEVAPVTSEDFPRPAKRPHYSSLDNTHLKAVGLNTFRTWQEALADYLSEEVQKEA